LSNIAASRFTYHLDDDPFVDDVPQMFRKYLTQRELENSQTVAYFIESKPVMIIRLYAHISANKQTDMQLADVYMYPR